MPITLKWKTNTGGMASVLFNLSQQTEALTNDSREQNGAQVTQPHELEDTGQKISIGHFSCFFASASCTQGQETDILEKWAPDI